MLNAGSTFGQYQIESLLGQGSMGEVYKAFDTTSERSVALKLLNEEFSKSGDYRSRLAAEAQMAAKVDSPYVVKIWGQSEIDNRPFIAMEYVAGRDIRTASNDLDFDQKFDVACGIAAGIEAAHSQGLIHRDLKPENIKLAEDGLPRILDFGLAKTIETDNVDEFGNIEGTLHYLSPEQLSGEPLTISSDVFSYGTILYELFTGQRPFEGEYAASIIYAILHEDPAPPCDVNEQLPVWFDSLILKLLAKRSQDRFQSIGAAAEFMKSCVESGAGPVAEEWVKPSQTVTVIDLKNLSGDSNWDYFCEGFTDDVINELSRRTDLSVSAEPSTSYRRNIHETFEKCHSDFVMIGSLMKFENAIKLTLSIYGNRNDALIWSKNYSEPSRRLFEVLSSAAEDAATALAENTNSKPVEVDEQFQADVTAYDFYLKGKSYYQTNKPDDLEFAAKMYTRALEMDPAFALAHSGLSDVYAFQYMAFYDRTPQRIAMSHAEALKAIELDPKLPDAYRSLARYYMFTGYYKKAEECLLTATNLNPKYALGHRTLAWLKEGQGDHEDATVWARKALALAPTDLETLLLLSIISMNQRKFTLAMATLQRAIELGPDYGRAYYNLGQVYMKLGVLDLSLENFLLATKHKGDPNCYIDCGYVHLIKKDYDAARAKFEESVASGYFPFVAKYFLGLTELFRGNKEASCDHFRQAVELTNQLDIRKPENVPVAVYRALALAGLNERRSSYATVREIYARNDLNGEVLYNCARCYALLGETMKAEEVLQKAIAAASGPTEKEAALDPHFSMMSIQAQ